MRKGPEFIRFFEPVVEVLKTLDGSGKAGEVTDLVVDRMNISDDDLSVQLKNGTSRIKNQIHWSRNYLVGAGYIDNSTRGIWSLTPDGEKLFIRDHAHTLEIFDFVQNKIKVIKNKETVTPMDEEPIQEETDEQVIEEFEERMDYKQLLISILRNLPPAGFEKLCKRLLLVSGFKNVKVLGKTGDGGIDGEGLLEVNPLLSFKVLFQSKKYGPDNSVQAHHVRDFRGAMQGRADKGIIITTGSFTRGARAEATRDGVPPIEIIDSEGLIDLFEKIELGLIPVKTWEVDLGFFEQFDEA